MRGQSVDRDSPPAGGWGLDLDSLEVIEIADRDAPEPAGREPLRWLAGDDASPRQLPFVHGGEDPTGSAGLWRALAGFTPQVAATS